MKKYTLPFLRQKSTTKGLRLINAITLFDEWQHNYLCLELLWENGQIKGVKLVLMECFSFIRSVYSRNINTQFRDNIINLIRRNIGDLWWDFLQQALDHLCRPMGWNYSDQVRASRGLHWIANTHRHAHRGTYLKLCSFYQWLGAQVSYHVSCHLRYSQWETYSTVEFKSDTYFKP